MIRTLLLAALSVSLAAAAPALAREGKFVGVIGGLSAGEIVAGAGYLHTDPAFAYGGAGPLYYGPPPGCVIRAQRVWTGYGWTNRRIRVCY